MFPVPEQQVQEQAPRKLDGPKACCLVSLVSNFWSLGTHHMEIFIAAGQGHSEILRPNQSLTPRLTRRRASMKPRVMERWGKIATSIYFATEANLNKCDITYVFVSARPIEPHVKEKRDVVRIWWAYLCASVGGVVDERRSLNARSEVAQRGLFMIKRNGRCRRWEK